MHTCILQDNKCFHCKDKVETLLHLLVHCLDIVVLWNDFREWRHGNTDIELNLIPAEVFYGVIFGMLLKLVLLVAKFCIIKSKQS